MPPADLLQLLDQGVTAVVGMGPIDKEKRRLGDLLKAIALLKHHDLHATGIIGAYHARRVAPLMARVLPLHQMTPVASLEGTMLS
jgi:hypothetical protein